MALLRPAIPVAIALVGLGLAGCLEDTSAQSYHASGEDAKFALGWAYDGQGAQPFEGYITIHADPMANTGEAIVEGNLHNQHWTILFDHFAEQPGKAFQDGGIAADLDEHGDTNVGDASIPKVRVDLAAWGDALVTVDGEPVPDPLTGGNLWVAHFMVIMTGVRDDASGAIHQAQGDGVYDPAESANGLAVEGDPEIHLVLKSHATAPPNATAVSNQSQSPLPTFSRSHSYESKYQNSEFNVTVSVTGTFAPSQGITFTLTDTNGEELQTLTLPQGNTREAVLAAPFKEIGTYEIAVEARGVQAGYTIEGAITPPSNVVMNFWWEDILFGRAAEAFESSATPHTHDDGGSDSGSGGSTAAPKAF